MSDKQCTKCGETKPLDMFTKDKQCKSGISNRCKACDAKRSREYYAKNTEKLSEYGRKHYKQNYDSEKTRMQRYRSEHKEVVNSLNAKRRADQRNATPASLTSDDFRAIRVKYTEAKWMTARTGIKHHVDHIVPLRGNRVSGLHVPWNLRVITAAHNMRKYNSLTEISQ